MCHTYVYCVQIIIIHADIGTSDIYNEIKRQSHMQHLSDIRMESFMDLFLSFETTLKRIEKLVCIQKEQCDEIKDRVEVIEKSQAISREQADFIKAQVATVTVRAASREQVDRLQNELCSISKLQSHLQRKQDQIACKQDLLHSTIANEQHPMSSVMSSPLLSPPIATWNQPVRASVSETFVKSRDQNDLPPILTVQPTGRDIQQPPVIDDELLSVLDDLSSIADAASTHSHSFSLPAVEDP